MGMHREIALPGNRRGYLDVCRFLGAQPISQCVEDLALGEPVNRTTWIVRVQHKPFVSWIWGGSLIIALGGLLAALDRRYRVAQRKRQAAGKTTLGDPFITASV